LHHRPNLPHGSLARCERCQHVIVTNKAYSIDRALAASIAGVVLLLVSLFLPFLALARSGIESDISVLDAVAALWFSDMRWLAVFSLAFIVMLPLVRLSFIAWVLWQLRIGRPPKPAMRWAFRWAEYLEPWTMAEIFMVGVVVSLVKISSLATLTVGLAFWSLLALIAVTTLISVVLCRDTVWQQLISDAPLSAGVANRQ
jgi:paraquat-inducible protein A